MGVYLTRPGAEVAALENSLSSLLLPDSAKAADRLKEPLDDKLAKLRKIRKDRFFSQLPAARQSQVDHALAEIEIYLKFNKDFLDKVQDPRLARTEADLASIEKSLNAVALPKDHAEDWKDTRVGRRPQLWANDIAILRKEVDNTIAWIHKQIPRSKELQQKGFALLGMSEIPPKDYESWLGQYKEYMDKAWPHSAGARLPGASGMTYETVYRFEGVEKAQQEWEKAKKQLKDVRDRLREP